MPRQRLAVLGSTGSIGVNTLEVAALHPDRFEVAALAAGTQVDALLAQCVRWRPGIAVMADAACALALEQKVRAAGLPTRVESGARAIEQLAASAEVDTVMAAIVGAAGLAPCLAAARAGKRLLLANKEALVVGGPLFLDAVEAGGATLLPIDSEHSAIFQALPADRSTWKARVDRLILTASGGPFRTWAPDALRSATPQQACAHPIWTMGRKISVDSATMMNKALEVIEAHHLFGMAADRIKVVIHPQSVIHSMVQYHDGSVIAQLGTPDMKVPISCGLAWPDRIKSGARAPDFGTLGALTFEAVDSPDHRARYPGLALAWEVLAAPPGSGAILNAANEVAVAAFLQNRIRFDQIHAVNRATLDSLEPQAPHDLADLLELDARARARAGRAVQALSAAA